MRWLVLATLTFGCAHMRGADVANVLITAAVIAIDIETAEPRPPATYCEDEDPSHVCRATRRRHPS